jgi:hypothetical protein
MDITVRRTGTDRSWSLEDLLGRPMGTITEYPPGNFTIHPEGNATATMHGLRPGPYASLDAALAEIETNTRGVCRMDEDHGPQAEAKKVRARHQFASSHSSSQLGSFAEESASHERCAKQSRKGRAFAALGQADRHPRKTSPVWWVSFKGRSALVRISYSASAGEATSSRYHGTLMTVRAAPP